MNAGSFELALALLRYGHQVSEIYGTVSDENFIYIKKIAELKMADLNAGSLEAAMSMIAGSCRSMGVTVEGYNEKK